MIHETAVQAMRKGYMDFEASWILASNIDMRRLVENFGAVIYKTYRVYEMAL